MVKASACLVRNKETQRQSLNTFIQDIEGRGMKAKSERLICKRGILNV